MVQGSEEEGQKVGCDLFREHGNVEGLGHQSCENGSDGPATFA